jgi:hypothetical protein
MTNMILKAICFSWIALCSSGFAEPVTKVQLVDTSEAGRELLQQRALTSPGDFVSEVLTLLQLDSELSVEGSEQRKLAVGRLFFTTDSGRFEPVSEAHVTTLLRAVPVDDAPVEFLDQLPRLLAENSPYVSRVELNSALQRALNSNKVGYVVASANIIRRVGGVPVAIGPRLQQLLADPASVGPELATLVSRHDRRTATSPSVAGSGWNHPGEKVRLASAAALIRLALDSSQPLNWQNLDDAARRALASAMMLHINESRSVLTFSEADVSQALAALQVSFGLQDGAAWADCGVVSGVRVAADQLTNQQSKDAAWNVLIAARPLNAAPCVQTVTTRPAP